MNDAKFKYCLETKGKVARRIPRGQHKAFAARAGIENSRLSLWLTKNKGIHLAEIFLVARELKVSLDWLLDDEQKDDYAPNYLTTKFNGEVIRVRKPMPKKSNRKRKSVDK
jgi:transcriptional regulator with XRE-family HTH domain